MLEELRASRVSGQENQMQQHVLKLDIAGIPERWITTETAACHYASGEVVWTLGDEIAVLRGGISRATGRRSVLTVHAIVAVRGAAKVNLLEVVPTLANRKLWVRDNYTCAFCGGRFAASGLTRDHVLPKSRGGRDVWQNVVAACLACNQAKRNRTPEEAGTPLLFAPYVPSRWEDLILSGRRILADQMAFLAAKLPQHSRARGLH
jgi:hypothetical protein